MSIIEKQIAKSVKMKKSNKISVYMCVYTCSHIHMCSCVVRPENDIGHILSLSTLFFETKFLTDSVTQATNMKSTLLTASPQPCDDMF